VRYEELRADEQAWVQAEELRWRRAWEIVAAHPHLDVSLVHHTLVAFERSPEERLSRGLLPAARESHAPASR